MIKKWMQMSSIVVISGIVCFFTFLAEAGIIVIEPDMFSDGTNVSNLYAGVTINTFTYNSGLSTPTYGPVYVTSNTSYGPAPTGTHLFANEDGNPSFSMAYNAQYAWRMMSTGLPPYPGDSFSVMLIQLDRPTNFFEIAASFYSDSAQIFGFDPSNALVGSCSFYFAHGSNCSSSIWQVGSSENNYTTIGTLQFGRLDTALDPSIKTIIIGGDLGSARFDSIRINSVPEPVTLLLLGMGIVGLLGFRKKLKLI